MPLPLNHNPNIQELAKILKRVCTENAHASGIIVRAYNQAIIKALQANTSDADVDDAHNSYPTPIETWPVYINNARSPSNENVRKRASEAFDVFKNMMNSLMCRDPLDRYFTFNILFGKFRTDQEVMVGLHSYIQGGHQRVRPVSVVSFGQSDLEDNNVDMDDFTQARPHTEGDNYMYKFFNRAGTNPENQLNDDIENGRVMEIDLVCSANQTNDHIVKVPGAGNALLLAALSDVLTRKKHGSFKYKSVITYAAGNNDTGYPLESSLKRLGFRPVVAKVWNTTRTPNNPVYWPLNRRYYVLDDTGNDNRFRKLANAFSWNQHGNKTYTDLCPLVTRTGLSYCK